MCILLMFLLLNESLCRLGYGNAKYNFHNAKDSYHSFIYRCCCFLRYFFRCLIFLAIQAIGSFGFLPSRSGGILCLAFFVSHPGSSALVTV